MLGLWDEKTPGCAGFCYLLSLWGAGEVMAFFALLITAVGVILAVQSLRATEKSSRQLLEHEQSANLQIPYRAVEEQDKEQIPDGAYLWIAHDQTEEGTWSIRGRLLNAGRYDAREVALQSTYRGKAMASNIFPAVPPYIEAGGYSEHFELRMPKDDGLPENQLAAEPVNITVEYADANVRNPAQSKTRTWLFEFPDRPLAIGDKALLISVRDDWMSYSSATQQPREQA